MAVRSMSKGGVICALAHMLLHVTATALLLSRSVAADAVILNAASGSIGVAIIHENYDDRFAGVGRIECTDSQRRGVNLVATGWVVGSADTVVTAAHILFRAPAAGGAPTRAIAPSQCAFLLYDRDQNIRNRIRIRYAVSPWAESRFRGDSSYDVAVLKLESAVRVEKIPAVKVAMPVGRPSINLIAFHSGFRDTQCAWITRGRQQAFPAAQQRYDASELRITSATRLFATSADSTAGSSGGMYYDERLGAAVGLHLGVVCDQAQPRYDPNVCFNYGLRFDREIVAMVDMVVRDQLPNNQLLVRDNSAPRLVLASRISTTIR
ncbi:MAG: trypsin-like peptidase domain-containing protein [Pseudomonadota bacterium]